jgi:hypothetical protein
MKNHSQYYMCTHVHKNVNDNLKSISDLQKYLAAGCRIESVQPSVFVSDGDKYRNGHCGLSRWQQTYNTSV